jgi:DNA-binding HxlR family transcriptional regulator
MPKQPAAVKKRRVRGSTTGRPIMALLDLLGRRWSLRIIWELRGEPLTSRALRSACDDVSPTVLQTRLTDLREADLVELLPENGYRLTTLGRELFDSFMPLHRFAERWSKPPGELISKPPPPSGWRRRPARS